MGEGAVYPWMIRFVSGLEVPATTRLLNYDNRKHLLISPVVFPADYNRFIVVKTNILSSDFKIKHIRTMNNIMSRSSSKTLVVDL